MHRNRRPGFTLIELLVVLAIMGLVLAIVLPALLKAPLAAKLERAKTEVANLDMALRAYEREYKVWPLGIADEGTSYKFTRDLVGILSGTNTDPANKRKNPYKRSFIEVGALSLDSNGDMVDPWGTNYLFKVDYNFDNVISGADGVNITGRTTAVWSAGDPAITPKKSIRSW